MEYTINTPGIDVFKTLRSGQMFRYKELPDGRVQVQATDRCCILTPTDDPCKFHLETISSGVACQDCAGVSCDDCDSCHSDSYYDAEGPYNYWVNFFQATEDLPDVREFLPKGRLGDEIFEKSKGIGIFKQDPWEALVSFIISQNNNIPRIQQVIENICETAGRVIAPGLYSFPTPDELLSVSLAKCGLGYRERFIKQAAEAVRTTLYLSEIECRPESLCTLQIARSVLCELNGVGPKVANCICLYGLGYGDAVPVDRWIERAIGEGIMKKDFSVYGKAAGLVQQYVFNYMISRGDERG